MSRRNRDEDAQKSSADQEPSATPEGTLAGKAPAATDNNVLAGNEPDGDASGRPGSSTMKPITTPDDASQLPAGQVRVKAKKTVLYGGMAYTEGQTFGMSEEEFEARKDRDELERA